VLIAALVSWPSAAHAAQGDAQGRSVEERTARVDARTLRAAARDGKDTAHEKQAQREFLEDSAANGMLYDAAQVNSATTGDVTTVWSDSVDLDQVLVTVPDVPDADQPVAGLGAIGSNNPSAADQKLARLGSSGLGSVTGQWGDRDGGTVSVTVDGYKLISGWERYRVRESKTDRDVYYYGHWATAVGKSVTGYDKAPYVVDVRSRPKSGYRSTFLQLRNYWPKVSQPSCSGGEIGIDVLGFGGSLPLQNCSSLSPDPDPTSITMKVVWSAGTCKDQTVEGADLGMAVDTKPGYNAILSDYSYARFNDHSTACDVGTSDDIRVIYADPGW
jgi:hypothetical protein